MGKWTDRQEETRLVTVEPLELGSMHGKVHCIPFVNAKALKRSKWEKRGLRKIIASGTQPLPATAPASAGKGSFYSGSLKIRVPITQGEGVSGDRGSIRCLPQLSSL